MDENIIREKKPTRITYARALERIRELEGEVNEVIVKYDALIREYATLLNANVKLADIIKEYNPHHFGGGEGRHDFYENGDWW